MQTRIMKKSTSQERKNRKQFTLEQVPQACEKVKKNLSSSSTSSQLNSNIINKTKNDRIVIGTNPTSKITTVPKKRISICLSFRA